MFKRIAKENVLAEFNDFFFASGVSDEPKSRKDIIVNSSLGTITHNADQECVLDLGRYQENESISVTVPYDNATGTVKMFVYTLNDKVFKKGYNKLSDGQLITETFEDTYIKGTVVTEKDAILYTSIPYDKGWSVYVDGDKVSEDNILEIGQAMLGINIERGAHEIEFKFEARGLKLGIIVSSATLAVLIFIMLLMKKRRENNVKPMLVPYPVMGKRYTTEVFLPLKKKNNTAPTIGVVQNSSAISVSDLPVRETIAPEKPVIREVFSPDNK